MDTFYELVKNIVIYLIIVTILKNLIGKSSYQKYISIFTGMVLIIIVAKPILNIFDIADTFTYYFDNNKFRIEAENITDKLNASDEASKQQILKAYKEVIHQQIEGILNRYELYAVAVTPSLNEEESSKQYGTIEELEVVATFTHDSEKPEKRKGEIKVDKIMINRDISLDSYQQKSKESDKYEEKRKKIKKEIANTLGMEEEKITLSIQE